MTHRDQLATLAAAALGAAAGFAGHPLVIATLGATAADLVSGYAKAMVLHKVESNRLGRGIFKIAGNFGLVVGLMLIGRTSTAAQVVANSLAGAFLFRELMSNVENAYVIGKAIGADVQTIGLIVRLLRLNEQKLLAEAGEKGTPDGSQPSN